MIYLLPVDLNSRCDPFHAVALLTRPYHFSYFDGTLGTLQFDFIFLRLGQPGLNVYEVRRALLAMKWGIE